MTTSMFNAKLLPTALSAAVVVAVAAVVGMCREGWNNT
ncbi:ilvB operon leader peptide IvbL [Escherichia coli]